MSPDGMIFAALVIAVVGGLIARRMLRKPYWMKSPEQQAAAARQAREDILYLNVGDQIIDATARTGRSTWQ